MKLKKRVLSLLLAAAVAVSSAPTFSAEPIPEEAILPVSDSQEENTLFSDEDASNIKFVQESFDEETGVLTMALKIKPTDSTAQDDDGMYTGTFIHDGYFAFQTDASTVVPILADGTPIVDYGEYIAFVGYASSSNTGVKDFLNWKDGDGRGKQIGTNTDLEPALGLPSGSLSAFSSGYMVTTNRSGSTNMLDCYLQFEFSRSTYILADADGYIPVAHLQFQCYNAAGQPAKDESSLYCNSILLPKTEEDAKEIIDQFTVGRAGKPSQDDPMAMGAGGYREKVVSVKESGSSKSQTMVMGAKRYAFAMPVLTDWTAKNVTGDPLEEDVWNTGPGYWGGASLLDVPPQREYAHMDDKYVVKNFYLELTNTFTGDMKMDEDTQNPVEIPDEELDFLIPQGDASNTRFPRYMIPTVAQTQADEEEDSWQTRRYNQNDLEEEKKVLMSYQLTSEVTDNSISRPEDDAETFFNNITWEFLMPANDGVGGITSMNDAPYRETGAEKEISWIGPDGIETTAISKEAIFTEEGSHYEGLKFQRIYDSTGTEFLMAAPLGVTLYWDSETKVKYTTSAGTQTVSRAMPQVHVTNEAADPESFLWKKTSDTLVQGEFYLQASYADQTTARAYTSAVTIRLYTAPPVVTSADLNADGLTVESEIGPIPGFEVGIPFEEGANKKDDTVSKGMITFRSTVYDQYGMPYSGEERSAVTFEPATDLMRAVYAVTLKGDNAFQVVPDEKDKSRYTIIYRDGFNVNDVVPGPYLLTVTCSSGENPEPLTMTVKKDADYLANMAVTLSAGVSAGEDENQVETIDLNVPELNTAGEKTTTVLTAYIRELANQWRVPGEQVEDTAAYDIVEGLRSDTAPINFDLDKIRESGAVSLSFEGYFPETVPAYKQVGIDIEDLDQGILRFDSSTYDGVEFYLTIKASYQSGTANVSSVEKKYKFVFHRAESRLEKIAIKAPVSLTVPTKAEGTDRILNLEVVPYDQYGSQWNWGEVVDKYKDEYPDPWKVTMTKGLDGVTLGGNDNHTELRVKTSTLPGVITLEAEYAGVVSAPTEIQIIREPSKALVAEVKYDKTEVTPPTVTQQDTTYTMTPAVTVWDQYGAVIPTDQDLYETRWSFVSDPQTELITLNSKTGVVTVHPCAPTKNLTVKMQVYQNGARKLEKQMTLSVRRAATEITSVEISESKVSYPTKDNLTGLIQLHADGTTQYGEGEDVTKSVVWSLESVELQSGSILTLQDGGIHFDNSAGTYTIPGMTFTGEGVLSFSNVSSEDQVPVSMQVKAVTQSDVASPVKEITIERPDPMPYELILSNNYLDGVDVPNAGSENSLTLTAYVRDQYSLIMTAESKQVAWSFTEGQAPQGLRLDGNVLKVDSTALGGIYYLTASYTGEEGDFTVEDQIIAVPVKKGQAVIGSLEFDGIQGEENSKDNPEIVIPSALSSGELYTLRVKAFDNFGNLMGEGVTWEVKNANGADVSFTNADTGRLLVKFSDAVKEGNISFTVKVTSKTNPSIFVEKDIALVKGEEVAAYAKVTEWTVTEGQLDEGKPVVPQRGAGALKIEVKAAVYSQYRNEMPEEKAEIVLEPAVYGASFTMEGDNQGTLLVQSSVARLDIPLVAYPKGQTEARDPQNSLTYLQLSRGVGYPFALELTKENWEVEIPVWETNGAFHMPAEETWSQYVTSGQVVDQYGAPYQAYHPVWKFAEGQDLTGISFDETSMTIGEDGSAVGISDQSTLTLKISNLAVPKGDLQKTVYLEVGYSGDSDDPAFKKTLKVVLVRDEPVESYMYYENVDETGVVTLQRPTTKDGKTDVRLFPVVYDQYGQTIDLFTMEMDLLNREAMESAGYVLEDEMGSAEDPEGEPVVTLSYVKDSSGEVMAEIHWDTGVFTIYPACTAEEFVFSAENPALPGIEKRAAFQIKSEELVPFAVEIQREHPDTYFVEGDQVLTETIGSKILDQYGAVYTKADVKAKWSLVQMDAVGNPVVDSEGNVVLYDEIGEDGLSKLPEDRLLTLTSETERNALLTIREKNYEKTVSTLLQCQLQKLNGATWGVASNSVVLVDEKKAGGSAATVMVTYYAGEYGKLVGKDSEEVMVGTAPQHVPGVKTYTGYGFLGWTMDGKTLIDPSTTPLYYSTTYSAVYKDITGTKFVDGYEDGTFQLSRKVTRAEFIKMIVSAMGGFDSTQDYGESFTDIPQGAWYENYIAFAKAHGLVNGYSDGTFRPKDNITRAEAAKILASALQLEPAAEKIYADVSPSSWYGGYVTALSQMEIIDGYEDGLFRPDREITRAESVKLIILITVNAPSSVELENIREYAYCPFTDMNRLHWAYPYILRATGIA